MKDCAQGEDEENCDTEQPKSSSDSWLLITLVSSALGILLTVSVFFVLRRWRRKRRMRQEESGDNSSETDARGRRSRRHRQSYGDTPNPVFGLPPPYYPDEYDGTMVEVIGELPPPYVFKPPSNEGPKSVLPTYNEAMSSKPSGVEPTPSDSEPNHLGSKPNNLSGSQSISQTDPDEAGAWVTYSPDP